MFLDWLFKALKTFTIFPKPKSYEDYRKEYNKMSKVGDKVYIDSYTSMGQSALGQGDQWMEIEKTRERYDEVTGERYTQLFVGHQWYDSRDGTAIDDKSMYFIDNETI